MEDYFTELTFMRFELYELILQYILPCLKMNQYYYRQEIPIFLPI